MNVTKALLDDYSVIGMFFNRGQKDINCVLIKSEKGTYLFTLTGNYNFYQGETLILNVSFKENNDIIISKGVFIVLESGSDYVNGTLNDCGKEITALLEKISTLEFIDDKYGRRKEQRILIGKKNSVAFGLSDPEQKLFSKVAQIIQPCAIIDASIHGICIITPFENAAFKNIDNFNIHLQFVNPNQTVVLQAHKVHSKLNNTNSRIFATISCQLLEPINYMWKERVINMIEKSQVVK